MIDSVAGAMMFAIPRPSTIVMITTCATLLDVPSVVIINNDVATIAIPVATTALLPNACTHRVDSGANTINTAACGMRIAPALTVEKPSTDCRYWVSKKIVPNSARNVSVIAPLAAEKRGFSKKRMSSIGLSQCNSHKRNATSTTTPTTNPVTTDVGVQPWL